MLDIIYVRSYRLWSISIFKEFVILYIDILWQVATKWEPKL